MKKRPFPIGKTVIRVTETDANNVGEIASYTEDSKYAYVRWTGQKQTTMHVVVNLCTLDDWRAMQIRQKGLRNAWTERQVRR